MPANAAAANSATTTTPYSGGITDKLREWAAMVTYAAHNPKEAWTAAREDFDTSGTVNETSWKQARALTATALRLLLRNVRALVQVSLMWFVLNVLFSLPFTTLSAMIEPTTSDLGAAAAAAATDLPSEGFSLSMSAADAQAEALMEMRAREVGSAMARGPAAAGAAQPTTPMGQLLQMVTQLIDWVTQAGGRASTVIVMWLDPTAGAVVRRSETPTGPAGRGAMHAGTHAGKGRVLTVFGGSTAREVAVAASPTTGPSPRRQWDVACHSFLRSWKKLGAITETEALYNLELLGLGIASLPVATLPWTLKRVAGTALSQVVTALKPELTGRSAVTQSRKMMRGSRRALVMALPMTVICATLCCIVGATVISVVASCAVGTAAGYILGIGTADGIGATLGVFGVLAGSVVRATPFIAMRALLYAAWARNGGASTQQPLSTSAA